MGTASYWTSPGATGPCSFSLKLELGALGDVGVRKPLWPSLGVAEGALLGGACSLKGLSAGLLWVGRADVAKADGGSATCTPGVNEGPSSMSPSDL